MSPLKILLGYKIQKEKKFKSRISGVFFSEADHRSAWYVLFLAPVFFLTNIIFALGNLPGWITIKVCWVCNSDHLVKQVDEGKRPIIYYGWHAYAWLGLHGFRNTPERLVPILIGHDGPLSRMNQRAHAWFGYTVWVFRRKSPVRPRQQIIDMVRSQRCHIALAADSGGPYGKVKEGLLEVARETNALLVPVVIRGRGIAELRRPQRLFIPLPFASLVVYTGEALEGDKTSLSECQQALEDLEEVNN